MKLFIILAIAFICACLRLYVENYLKKREVKREDDN